MKVREAAVEDAAELSRITIEGRWAILRGLLPDEVIARFTREESARNWARALRDMAAGRDSGQFLLVAEAEGGSLTGLALAGPERTGDQEYPGEVLVLSVDDGHRGQGAGRMLVWHAAERLADAGLTPFLIRVLTANTAARRFYEALGGTLLDRVEQVDEEGVLFDEVAYGWAGLTDLR
jgi:ribosomal protein S18 acetylase RimI-like enzyme